MPCKKYKSKKQRALCYTTKGWKDLSKIKGSKDEEVVKGTKYNGGKKL